MMNSQQFRELIATQREMSKCLTSCHEAIESGAAGEICLGPGGSTAGYWLRLYRIRHQTSAEGGLEPLGFEETLRTLEARDESEPVLMGSFQSHKHLFVILVSDLTKEIVGCMRVNRRMPPI
jgi:hypothetical protein